MQLPPNLSLKQNLFPVSKENYIYASDPYYLYSVLNLFYPCFHLKACVTIVHRNAHRYTCCGRNVAYFINLYVTILVCDHLSFAGFQIRFYLFFQIIIYIYIYIMQGRSLKKIPGVAGWGTKDLLSYFSASNLIRRL